MRYVFDIEGDGLLDQVSQIFVAVVKDIKTGERWTYTADQLDDFFKRLGSAKSVIGHNIIGYDLPALKKVHGFELPKTVKVYDTFLMSLILDYDRFPHNRHGLDSWGELLGRAKVVHEDWTQYSEEMRHRCEEDVEINFEVWKVLINEFKEASAKYPILKTYMEVEHAAAKWCADAEYYGWPFDEEKGLALKARLEAEVASAVEKIEPILGYKCVAVDKKKGIVEPKKPRFTKKGHYDFHTCNWFDLHPLCALEDDLRMVDGPYSRIRFEKLKLSSTDDMKLFLFRHGWVPTVWNTRKDKETGEIRKTSPKIDDESLESLKGHGQLYKEYNSSSSRLSILNTWLNNAKNGRVHGSCFSIGTPSMRATHSIIVNVPGGHAKWGREMRELFTCPPGWKLIGCDSSGNQARGLAHYLGDPDYIDLLLNGDVHSYNAQVLTNVLSEMNIKHVVTRDQAKRVLYAFLFGASGKKLWSYIFGTHDARKGKKLKDGFTVATPGLKALTDKLEAIFQQTKRKSGKGYIIGVGGNKIYVDSSHKLLVYLLQATEKATCAAAIMLTMKWLEEENIPYQPCIFMHDEEDFIVPEEHAERAAEIGKLAFKEGPKLFGIKIMDGDAKIGNNWYEVH